MDDETRLYVDSAVKRVLFALLISIGGITGMMWMLTNDGRASAVSVTAFGVAAIVILDIIGKKKG